MASWFGLEWAAEMNPNLVDFLHFRFKSPDAAVAKQCPKVCT